MSDTPILIGRKPAIARVEICRSYTMKWNRGNYESSDYFCSQRSECAAEDAEEVSAALYAFCKREVLKAMREDMEQRRKGAA